jgi:hypothetical protein
MAENIVKNNQLPIPKQGGGTYDGKYMIVNGKKRKLTTKESFGYWLSKTAIGKKDDYFRINNGQLLKLSIIVFGVILVYKSFKK